MEEHLRTLIRELHFRPNHWRCFGLMPNRFGCWSVPTFFFLPKVFLETIKVIFARLWGLPLIAFFGPCCFSLKSVFFCVFLAMSGDLMAQAHFPPDFCLPPLKLGVVQTLQLFFVPLAPLLTPLLGRLRPNRGKSPKFGAAEKPLFLMKLFFLYATFSKLTSSLWQMF